MKNIWKYFIATAVLTTAVVAATGCSQWDPVYKDMDAEGYTVSVRFDANGGAFAQREGVEIVDVFKPSDYDADGDGIAEIRVLSPDDPARQKVSEISASRTGYFLAGWYQTRTLRTDADGNRLDDYGEIIPADDTTTPQGYIYSDRWDFEADRLEIDLSNTNLTSTEPQITLYAAWVPYFTFEFYAKDNATGQFAPMDTGDASRLKVINLPAWDESTGRMDMKDFPARDGMTFEAAYLDEAMTQKIEGQIAGPVDYDRGICTAREIKVYTTWQEGNWYRVYNAKQFYSNSRPDGHYVLMADLDFSSQTWAPALTRSEFTGTIIGNGHTIRNVTTTHGDTGRNMGGLFGALGARAHLENVTFENITFTFTKGSRMPDSTFGTFAGSIRDGATLTGVGFSGTLVIGGDIMPRTDYRIGLICGSGSISGLDLSKVSHKLQDPNQTAVTYTVDEVTGEVSLTFAE